jgi:hypothetical protein
MFKYSPIVPSHYLLQVSSHNKLTVFNVVLPMVISYTTETLKPHQHLLVQTTSVNHYKSYPLLVHSDN